MQTLEVKLKMNKDSYLILPGLEDADKYGLLYKK